MRGNIVDANGVVHGPDYTAPTNTQKLIVEQRQRGKSFRDIAEMYSITPDQAYRLYTEYVEASHQMNEAEYRMLQLQRLEKLIDALWPIATDTNALSVDHVKVMLDVLKEVTKLLGLHKTKTEQILQVIDQRQITLVTSYVDIVSDTLKQQVLNTVTAKKARAEIEEKWDEWLAEASERPLEAMRSDVIEA